MDRILHHKGDKQDLRGAVNDVNDVKDVKGDGPQPIQVQVKDIPDLKGLQIESPHTPTMTQGMVDRLNVEKEKGSAGRRLIVGCDGTWVNSEKDKGIPSNVTRLCRALRSSSIKSGTSSPGFKSQLIYYHAGIGTGGDLVSKYVGGGTGSEISEHIRECYGFLCNNWSVGDEIFLFGFSRGAYTARAVSAVVSDVGLLTAQGMEYFYEILEDWKNQNVPSMHAPKGPVKDGLFEGMDHRPKMPSVEYRNELHKRGYTILDVPIKAVGVWDTVGALGIPPILGFELSETELLQYSFVNTKVSQAVTHAFHALALDEHRAAFSPAVWETPDVPNNLLSLKQCWFPGVHSNVGGGWYPDQGLSNITLAWMVTQLQSAVVDTAGNRKALLDFDVDYLKWVFDRNVVNIREVDSKVGFRGWGKGKIEETLDAKYRLVGKMKHWTTSKSLSDFLTPGDVPRTPGQYEEFDARGGHGSTTGKMMNQTGETVHPCTRVRVFGGGKGVSVKDVEPAAYVPIAMKGWTAVRTDKDKSTGGDETDPLTKGFAWQSADGKTTLPEEELGQLEMELLGMSQVAFTQGHGH